MKKDSKHIIEKRIFQVLTGNIGTDEKIWFENWLNADPDNNALFQKYKSTWELTGDYLKDDKNWNEITEKINSHYSIPEYITTVDKHPKVLLINYWQKVAAAILLILALGFVTGVWIINTQHIQLAATEHVRSNVLPDGSQIALNKGSLIEYSKRFNRTKRELTLKGEAFFNVSSNKERPFLIHCLQTTTRVVGTKFNIYSDPVLNEVKVSVTEGVVEFYTENFGNHKIVLHKGEEGLINCSNGMIRMSQIKDINFNAWNTRELVFEETPLDQVILALQKYFNTPVIFEGIPSDIKITTIYRNPTLQKVMNELHVLAGINAEFKNDTLYIK